MIKPVKKMQKFSFLIYISLIKIMYLIKKGTKKLRKMRIFEIFFSQFDKIIIIIRVFSVNFNFHRFLQYKIKGKNINNFISSSIQGSLFNIYHNFNTDNFW